MNFKKEYKRIFFYFFLLVIIIFIVSYLLKISRPILDNFIVPSSQPAPLIISNEEFKADVYFSNEESPVNFSALIIKEIDRAQKTLEIAMYSFKSLPLEEAVYRASERGVKVFLILGSQDQAAHDIYFNHLPKGIKRLDLGAKNESGNTALMHHKFAIIDRGEINQKLIFGSFNWTKLQEEYDQSFLLISTNGETIKSFGQEFTRLFSRNSGREKLRANAYSAWALNLRAGSSNNEVWFGPGRSDQNMEARIRELIKEAKREIKIIVWHFTDKSLAEEIIKKAETGVKIIIITDSFNFNNRDSVFPNLLAKKRELKLNNLEILTDDSLTLNTAPTSTSLAADAIPKIDQFLHHHLLIIDNEKVLFGTNNWSKSGFFFNDEASIITNESKILDRFLKSFDYNYRAGKVVLAGS